MVKKACYTILSTPVIYEKYGDIEKRVFKDPTIRWKQCEYVSGYWPYFADNLVLTQDQVIKRLAAILIDLQKEACEYHMDRHKFFTEILHKIKIGEKVFIRYVEENELILNQHLQKKFSEMIQYHLPSTNIQEC